MGVPNGGARRLWPGEAWGVVGVAVAAAVAGGLAGCHPTGTPVVDPVYGAALAAAVTVAASRSGRATVLWLAVVAAALSRGPIVVPAVVGLFLAFWLALLPRPSRLLGAVSGALTVQLVLRWSHVGFHGATALIAAAAMMPVGIHALLLLPRRARFWVIVAVPGALLISGLLSVPFALEALQSHGQINQGITATQSALQSVSAGDATSGTQELTAATADFRSAQDRLGSWWTLGAALVPVVAQQRHAVVGGATLARQVTAVAGQQAAHIDFEKLHLQGGRIDLAEVGSLEGPLGLVDGQLTAGLRRLAALRSGWLVAPLASRLDKLGSELQKADSNASLALEAVTAAPSLLGGQGTRHYFVALLDTSESRGLDGVLANYGELTVADGRITPGTFTDVAKLNAALAAHGGGHLTGPPSFLARYATHGVLSFAQDVTFAPDLPTATDVISQLLAEAGGGQIDGVLVIDPRSLASLLNFTGPIDVPGLGELSSANAAEVLEKGEYTLYPSPADDVARRATLDQAMKMALGRLSGGSLPGPRDLAAALSPDVRSGDLLFWSTHPADQPLLTRVGLAGEFPQAGGQDLLAVVTQNSDQSKIDAYLQRTISDQVSYDPSNGRVSATVTVSLHNEAPASGLPSEVIGSYDGSGIPLGANRTWLSIYSPLGLVGATVGGRPFPLLAGQELGADVYSGYVTIGSGATATVTVHLQGRVLSGAGYRLTTYEQPMVLADRLSVTVSPSGGWKAHSSASPAPNLINFLNYRFSKTS